MSEWGVPYEFVKFGMKLDKGLGRPHIYAEDNEGEVWEKVDNDLWESVTGRDKFGNSYQMRHSLNADELAKIMALNNTR